MTESTKSRAPRRFPPWVVAVLGVIVGGLFASWMGAMLGGLLGTIVWLSRR